MYMKRCEVTINANAIDVSNINGINGINPSTIDDNTIDDIDTNTI